MDETARFPNFAGKHAHDAIISPDAVVEAFREPLAGSIPETVVLLYSAHLARLVSERADVQPAEGYPAPIRQLHLVEDGRIGIASGFGIGASVTAMVVEQLAALGVRGFVIVGAAGAIQARCAIGDLVLCTGAVRDEGVSHHYLAPSARVFPTSALTSKLQAALERAADRPVHAGHTWTIDAPYRETVAEAKHYQAEGVLTVEMEAAALFAVGRYRGFETAAAFAISDSLADLVWNPQFGTVAVRSGMELLLDAALLATR